MIVPRTPPPDGGTLLVLGTGTGPAPDPEDPPGVLASADAVFAGPPASGTDPEAVALFYAEAWRVERISPADAAARLDAWFRGHPGGTAALMVAGPPADDVALGAAVDGLRLLRPDLRVDRRPGATVTPPRRNPLAH